MLLTKIESEVDSVVALGANSAFIEPTPAREQSAVNPSSLNNLSVVVARAANELGEHAEAWKVLAEHAVEANVFYEPWMLQAAVQSFGEDANLYFVFIYATDPLRPFGKKILCGFFPLELSRHYKKFPVPTFSLWKHLHAFLCTPLIRVEFAEACLATFFDWLESADSPARLMSFRAIAGDGLFRQLLIDELNNRRSLSFVDETYNRALFKPRSTEPAVVEGISGRHKKELRRKQNRLAEVGRVEYVALESEREVETWIQEFLQLELRGWKGREGSAFASQTAQKGFFEAAVKAAFANRQLMMLALRLNGEAIAMKCNFLSNRGAFAFKIVFDESYSQYSPGVLLEMENMYRLQASFETEWMDSCAVAEHFMINRLWTSRRNIATILFSTGKAPADLLVSALPFLRWGNRKLKALRKRS